MSTVLSKSQQAYSTVHDRILTGEYAPGERLVLGRIGQELGCSVVPVREAIRRLEAEGMVTFERNVGARVAVIDEQAYLETMETLSIIEGAAVSLAAPFVSIADLASAREVNDRMRALLEDFDPVEFTNLNERFHRALSGRCPNSHLNDLVDRGWTRLDRLRRSTFTYVPERAAASIQEHDRILQLIGEGADPRTIELAVREHRLATPKAYLHRTDDPGDPEVLASAPGASPATSSRSHRPTTQGAS
ncbi:GntR family transcriptional regulator [Brachybacterium endophyticum]|uniref:GntR family transcriptional regulator n=1 Tax=Brachybacterium endophyticum TaxID=2182385 RepID=A0A2U2RMV1_9MICO|nr:GntR family transcriptional regulator [Brachybacterium endophyticum]PWH07161.1 GntR family transcriptional regulator [Brachybacterium endophyticum]